MKAVGEKWHLPYNDENNLNDIKFLIKSHGDHKEVTQHSSNAQRKKLSIQNPISIEDCEWRRNQDILRIQKTMRICQQQTYPYKTAKGSFWNRIQMILKESWNIKKEEQESKNKLMQYAFLLLFSKLYLMV